MIWTKLLSFFIVLIVGGFFIYEGYLGEEAKKKVVSPGRIRAIILGPGLIIALIVGLFRECSLDSTSHNPLGEWTVQLSCDDISICNQCRKVSFTTDGFITTTNDGRTSKILRWKIKNDRLELIAFDKDSTFETGTYSMRYHTYGKTTELELVDVRNSFCYELQRPASN
jgi:hypothetical protein